MGKKPKHMFQYQGPTTLLNFNTEPGHTGEISCIFHPIPLIRWYLQLQLHIDNTIPVGSFVAVLDNDTDTNYDVGS